MQFVRLFTFLSFICFFVNCVSGQEIPENVWFQIQSTQEAGKSNNGYWDIKGHPKTVKEGERHNVQVFTIDNGNDRLYRFEEVDENEYIIIPQYDEDCCIQIEESPNRDGANIYISELDSETNNGIFKLVHLNNGNWKILSLDGRGICLAGRSSANSNGVHMWTDHPGAWTEWQFINPSTRQRFIPEVEKEDANEEQENVNNVQVSNKNLPEDITGLPSGNLTGKGAESFVSNLNQSYREILNLEKRVGILSDKMNLARKTIEKTSIISGKLNELDASIKRLRDALNVFNKIPVVGPPTTALTVSLGQVQTRVSKVNDKVQSFEKPIVRPAFEIFAKMCDATQKLDDCLISLNTRLIKVKEQYAASSTCLVELKNQELTSRFENSSVGLSNNLTVLNRELGIINNDISMFEEICDGINKLAQPVKVVDKGINGINKVFKKTDVVTKKISAVLDKRFKKKIMGKKINVSVKDIISGGKVGKAFQQAADKWAGKALKPVLKKLKIQIPEIPGVDDLLMNIEVFKAISAKLNNYHKILDDYQTKTVSLQDSFNQQIDMCLKDVPCK